MSPGGFELTIYVGVCVGNWDRYNVLCHRSIAAAMPEAVFVTASSTTSIAAAYNEILMHVRARGDAELLLLVHDDVVVADGQIAQKCRAAFDDPTIGVVGVIGSRRPAGLAWWQAVEKFGRVDESRYLISFGSRRAPADVDVVDGLFLALSPWVVQNLSFDEKTYQGFHAYEADMCLSVQTAGRRVVVRDFDIFHATKGGLGNPESFARADRAFRAKWRGSNLLSGATRTWDTKAPIRRAADIVAPTMRRLRGRMRQI